MRRIGGSPHDAIDALRSSIPFNISRPTELTADPATLGSTIAAPELATMTVNNAPGAKPAADACSTKQKAICRDIMPRASAARPGTPISETDSENYTEARSELDVRFYLC